MKAIQLLLITLILSSNLLLAQDTANDNLAPLTALVTYFEKKINADRIVSKGYGESSPVASNDTSVGRQKNRRTEVRIIEE